MGRRFFASDIFLSKFLSSRNGHVNLEAASDGRDISAVKSKDNGERGGGGR